MNKRNKRFGANKFNSVDENRFTRNANSRQERSVKESLPKIVFSLKDFDIKQIPPGQTYVQWEKDGILSAMLKKFEHVCGLDIVEAQKQRALKIYGSFPPKTDFKPPAHIEEGVNWAVVTSINGQKGRVAGHVIENVFYIVFLDLDHRFYISDKKNT